jgi:HMG (high mobility group) box
MTTTDAIVMIGGLKTVVEELKSEILELKKLVVRQQKATKKKAGGPKHALTAYTFYSMAIRPEVKTAHPEAEFGDISKIIGEQWKALTDEQKIPYVAKAEADKKRYAKALKAFNAKSSGSSSESEGEEKPVAKKVAKKPAKKVVKKVEEEKDE